MKKWIFIPLLVILLVGFICMTLILVEGINFLEKITIRFIKWIRRLKP